MHYSLLALEHALWSDATFGNTNQRGPEGPLKHLIKEAGECLADPGDIEEYADCLLLILDASRRAGITSDALVRAAYAKLQKNKARTWPATSHDQPVEHLR